MKVWEEWKARAEAAEARVDELETQQAPLETRIRELQEDLDRIHKMYEAEQTALENLRNQVLTHANALTHVCYTSCNQQAQREYEGQPLKEKGKQ